MCFFFSALTLPSELSSHSQALIQCNGNSSSGCETVGVDGFGVNNTDFILYVGAVACTGSNRNSLGFGTACQLESSLDR